MKKAIYISGIVFACTFIIICGYYADQVSRARMNIFLDRYSDYSFGNYNSYSVSSLYRDLTLEAGVWSLVFILFFIAMNLIGLMMLKTKTSKVISIIGLTLSAIFLLWDLAVVVSPGFITFDEVSPGWVFLGVTMLAFSIIGLIQSIRFEKKKHFYNATSSLSIENDDLLDS